MSNIVSGDRRARRTAAVAAPIDYAALDKCTSSDDSDSSADQQAASSSEEESDAAASDNDGMLTLSIVYAIAAPYDELGCFAVCSTSILNCLEGHGTKHWVGVPAISSVHCKHLICHQFIFACSVCDLWLVLRPL